ncbi:TonB-dependent copper receptor [Pectobacterium atrosepticum]|uniref:TonB-dependent copper receptor n=1 Tax=Pectobacterium atrosepticum TaxID=29471 RepID=UPI00039C15FE|nr:TonB-dependent copper receptor [Pectobacterium atrosepticum]GKV84868.1 TonB-dependent copper receptor [Pectobacterium carotovorum subsp. carotovorum]AIA71661.1 TonB-dependent receptor [Pectobacterium atrosepticum]AIK13535.1 TonB dependent receptor [Pectobacterium atrosepticum]ATY90422.1 TonB-dependent copper receptor [Pectobacterium atrosepticum]KFX16361.1 TonB-dependent receptor [Pectobacterium atrosepticum]
MKKIEFVYTPAASLVLVALSSLPVMAQGDHDHSASHAMLNDDAVMVVTAPDTSPLTLVTSPKTPRQPVPASDGSDYLKTIPGFSQIRNGGTNGDPVFRGMFGSRLRILSNNGEMLGACPSRMDAPSSYISPESYDLLTFTKGPQTVLWGAGNSAGTVRFERTQPRFDKPGIQGNASVLAASNDRHDENADVSFGSEEGYVRLIGNKSQSGDYKEGDGKRVASKWDKWNADVALGWTPDSDTLLELTAGKGDGEARYAGRGMDGSQFKRESLGLRAEKSNIGNVFDKLEASVYYNYADHVMDNYTLRSPGGMGMMSMPMASQLDRKTVGGRMMATWIWSDYELKSGADMQTNTHRRWRNDSWKKDAQFNTYGVFSELTWQATGQSKVIGGTRMDKTKVENDTGTGASERHDTLPAGFIRVEHTLADSPVMLYAGVGYTERFPDYWELFSPTYGPSRTQSAFDHVKTEKTTQLDIGAQYSGERLNSWVSAYVGRVNDFILFRYDPMNARVSEADNVNATIMGGETGFSYKLTDSWKTDASLAYSWAKNTDDHRPLPQIPPLEARLGLSWEKGNWSSTGLLRLVSQQNRVAISEGNVVGKDFDNSPGFAIFSANAAYRVNQYVKLSTGVDNLFNTTYSEHLNLAGNSSFGYSANTSVNEPGRTYWAKVNVTF